jgi:predicted GNAT family acetyltransferase
MRAQRHHDLAAFKARVEPLLVRHEAENNLILGLLGSPAAASALLLDVTDEAGAVVVAALQTPPHNLIVTDGPPSAIAALVERLAEEGVSPPGVVGPAGPARQVAAACAARRSLGARMHHRMRVLECGRLAPPRPPSDGGRARPAVVADLALLVAWSEAFARDTATSVPPGTAQIEERIRAGSFLLWETDRPVAMAAISRRTPGGCAIAYVYTPDALRRRGYASAVTAALTAAELGAGHRCFLFTDSANPTSNKIYEAMGYAWVCDVEEWRLD